MMAEDDLEKQLAALKDGLRGLLETAHTIYRDEKERNFSLREQYARWREIAKNANDSEITELISALQNVERQRRALWLRVLLEDYEF